MLRVMLEEDGLERLTKLRQVISSGEELGQAEVERLQERLAGEIDNLYGPTEASVDVTWRRCARGEGVEKIPIGRAIANTKIYVLDEAMEVVAEGVRGEIYIGGEGVGRGYWRKAGETAAKYVPDPYSEVGGERLYRTGDEGRVVAGGEVVYEGRLDEQVKVRGMRLELGEVERVLEEKEGVKEAVVVLKERANVGKQLVGYVVEEEGEAASEEELREYLRERLAEWMVPVRYVKVERLPLSPSGKVDRKALPAPSSAWNEVQQDYVAPRTQIEKELAAICTQVLGVERMGVHDNFFDLGGHSLLVMQVVSRVRQLYNVALPLGQLFESPTLAGLAQTINALREAADDPATAATATITAASKSLDKQLAELDQISDEEVKALLELEMDFAEEWK
jgi:acyl carrier protein